jgi:hypothetical protein
MFAILYETGTSGFYLGYDTTFEDAENRFSRITDDLLENISNGKTNNSEKFFEMYGVFNASFFCTNYECYKIDTHKNQILNYKLIFQMVDFCLYIIEIDNKFRSSSIERNQNYFYYAKNKHIEGALELIMN